MDGLQSILIAGLVCSVTLSATWKSVPAGLPTSTPPRSGATAAYISGASSVLLFGGYAEPEGGARDVTNDLLSYSQSSGWTLLQPPSSGNFQPGARLASAAAATSDELLLFGGWDPQVPGSGGVILDDVWSLDLKTNDWTRCAAAMPRGPTSRHCAVNVGGLIIVHTFRCLDSILVWDAANRALRVQPTTGNPPSSRGLHVAVAADDRTMLIFGGAAKAGTMVNDCFALDVQTWVWRPLEHAAAARPSARAGACAAPLPGGGGMLVYGGAESSANGLLPRSDLWAFTLGGDGSGAWKLLLPEDATDAPGPRNAATLTPLGDGDYLLHGGWRPFVSTYSDSYVLHIDRE